MERGSGPIAVSLASVDGTFGRFLTYPDGSTVVQKWNGRSWATDKSRVVVRGKVEPIGEKTLHHFHISEKES